MRAHIGVDCPKKTLCTDFIKDHRGVVTPDPHSQPLGVKPTLHNTQWKAIIVLKILLKHIFTEQLLHASKCTEMLMTVG